MRHGRSVGAVAAAVLLTLVISGCTASETSPVTDANQLPEVSIDGYEDVTATLDHEHAIAVTPVTAISVQGPDYMIRLLHAIAVRGDKCMVEAGFEPVADERDWSPYLQEEDRTYGLWSVAYASQYGVSLASGTGAPDVNVIDMGVERGKQYGLCLDEGRESLREELLWSGDMNIDSQIRLRAYELTLASDEGQAAKADWQGCMEDAGIVLDSADGRPVQQYQERGKEAEIAAIVVEAECARSTNAVQTLYDIQARYEAALMDTQSAQIQAFIEKRDEVISVFEDAIAGR